VLPIAATARDKLTTVDHDWPVTSDEEPFLTEREAAAILRVSARTLRRWRQQGTAGGNHPAPPVAGMAGRHALYRRADLLAWLRRERSN
jgi:hypothetical protein